IRVEDDTRKPHLSGGLQHFVWTYFIKAETILFWNIPKKRTSFFSKWVIRRNEVFAMVTSGRIYRSHQWGV
ncbi:MAG: hypothetical protein RSF73_08815, partial [Ruthenibacterium sp.]